MPAKRHTLMKRMEKSDAQAVTETGTGDRIDEGNS